MPDRVTFEFAGAVQPVEIHPARSSDAFAVMSSQVRGVIDAADELQDRIADAETEMLDGSRRTPPPRRSTCTSRSPPSSSPASPRCFCR